ASSVVNILLKVTEIYYKYRFHSFAPLGRLLMIIMNTKVRKIRISIISSIALAIGLTMLISNASAQSLIETEPGTTLSPIPIPVAVEVDDFMSLSTDIGVGLQVNL